MQEVEQELSEAEGTIDRGLIIWEGYYKAQL